MNTQQILETTFEQMPNHFTSREFAKRARINGLVEDKFFAQGNAGNFLHARAFQTTSNRCWSKSKIETQSEVQIKIEQAIALLKFHGYKIMKQETQYTEV
jgi:hypothetical protein